MKADPEGLYFRPFKSARLFREYAAALEVLRRQLRKRARILDLGCGPGWTSWFLAQAGYHVIGVDISEAMIAVAERQRFKVSKPPIFFVADIEELDLERRDYDAVLLFDALHHCPSYREVLGRAYAHLRPGGCILLMEPSWLHHHSGHARKATERFGVTELGFTRHRLGRALRAAGFRRVTHYYDPGEPYHGFLGLLFAQFRLWCGYLIGYPRLKQIVLAHK